MALISSLIHESTTTTGTGNVTVAAISARQRFSEGWSTGGANVFYYAILHRTADEWEYGTGSLSSTSVLVRDTVIASSNSNALVNFSAGTKDVLNDHPAEFQLGGITPKAGADLNMAGFNIGTTGTTLELELDTDGTPLVALTVGSTDPFGNYAHKFGLGSTDGPVLCLEATGTTATGAYLVTYHNTSDPDVGDFVGGFYMEGKNLAAGAELYGSVETVITDLTAGLEDTELRLGVMSGGTLLTALTLGGTGPTFVGTGRATAVMQNNDGGAEGGYFQSFANSATPAADDEIGGLEFYGKDSGANTTWYGGLYGAISDPTNASEDSRMEFWIKSAGADLTALTLGTTDFSGDFGTLAHQFHLGSGDYTQLVIRGNSTGVGGPMISGFADSSSPANSDDVFYINAYGRDSAANIQQYGFMGWKIEDVTSGSEDSSIRCRVVSAGSSVERLRIDGDGLKFHGDTAAANALDDYEEGTWSPTISAPTPPTITYTNQTGVYTKIGNLVIYTAFISINTYSGGTGNARLSLPFATVTYAPSGCIITSGVDWIAGTSATTWVSAGNAWLNLVCSVDNVGESYSTAASYAAGDYVQYSGHFYV